MPENTSTVEETPEAPKARFGRTLLIAGAAAVAVGAVVAIVVKLNNTEESSDTEE